ncbi:recombinase family protein [Shewanella xiamenensis]|uniref:recombinase family protein n=1 Tax=Shewanella xiamenensis TaxID=332186 RepID=UPI00214F72E6|nr:recombinase family protein [Shewanella xiamenensis]MCR4534518.1 recombinase family protein [Shewanella xiamenensis]WHF55718.1 recombinase family protein [Shewanella xiamenensis]
MFIRAYLRASTKEQNAERARESLIQFATQHDHRIAAFYIENVSGATLHRPELMRLIAESGEGDIVLVEQIDRLARLKQSDWDTLKQKLASKRLAIVSPELPTSWLALQQHSETDFTGAILQAVNAMMLDMLAAVARKDYDDRRRRQSQGIAKAKADGKYNGRQPDLKRHQHIASLLKTRHSYSDIQDMLGCSRHLIATISKNVSSAER